LDVPLISIPVSLISLMRAGELPDERGGTLLFHIVSSSTGSIIQFPPVSTSASQTDKARLPRGLIFLGRRILKIWVATQEFSPERTFLIPLMSRLLKSKYQKKIQPVCGFRKVDTFPSVSNFSQPCRDYFYRLSRFWPVDLLTSRPTRSSKPRPTPVVRKSHYCTL